ncbi:MAG: ABC-F family ATP-binding cassette domain-containing protein [Eubacteriales bacterium]
MISFGTNDISLEFGTDVILSGISFSINEGERLGIVGVNGAGKSSLMKIIAGISKPSSGSVYTQKGASVGMLAQNEMLESERSVFEEMLGAFPALRSLEESLAQMSAEIERRATLAHDNEYEKLISRFAEAQERFRADGGYEYRSKISSTLAKFGFDESRRDVCVKTLSGGERTRLALVRLLLSEPDILLLDEPTNHLDADTLYWLEEHLRSYPHTLAVISHDRYFLDRVATKILDIEHTKATLYNGNYAAFTEKKAKNAEILERHYKNQQREIARIEAFIEQQRRWNRERNIIAAESREKALARMKKIDAPKSAPKDIKFAFGEAGESGNDVLYAQHLSKSYGDKRIFSDVSFTVKKNDRILIIGPNGCGKSTLAKMIGGMLGQDAGTLEFGSNVVYGYYDQEQQSLDENSTVLDEVVRAHEKLGAAEIRSALASFLFFDEDIGKLVCELSGGEKARLMLCKMMLSKINLLILDEPTNHLDINSREILEDAVLRFHGTVIAISHDRYFAKKIATRIFDMTGGVLFDYRGGYDEYMEYKHSTAQSEETAASAARAESGNHEKYMENKRLAAEIRKREKQIERAEAEIEALEAEKAALEREAQNEASSDYVRLSEIASRTEEIDAKINAAFDIMAQAEDFLSQYRENGET